MVGLAATRKDELYCVPLFRIALLLVTQQQVNTSVSLKDKIEIILFLSPSIIWQSLVTIGILSPCQVSNFCNGGNSSE
jgi:hypothetical protein